MNFSRREHRPIRTKTSQGQVPRDSIWRKAEYTRHAASLLILLSFIYACAIPAASRPADGETQQKTEHFEGDDRLNATLWQQTSAEYRLLTQVIYAMAKLQLQQALADQRWTAEPSQKGGFQNLPPAVIMDVDETVLDNSVLQGRLIRDHLNYSDSLWKIWGVKQQATEVTGAVDFISFAQARGVTVFFVTNRDKSEEEQVRTQLSSIGVNLGEKTDTVLTRGERADWGSDKATRRGFIAQSHRVLLIIGDDLGDFISAYRGTPQDRLKEAFKHSQWGTQWILLPNPVYGSWERSLLDFNPRLSNEEILKRKLQHLRWVAD
jgi:5'-nucleotidase (lipoprotein e(P4) family)